ncbi:MAG TPA: hypothetical protein VNZ66_06510 [Aeromicrobium sp.]|nr:hypothetical protein [Aeromicrobium sp.]
MRIYLPVSLDDLTTLAEGAAIRVEGYVAASTEEEDELAALESAADDGAAVAVAEVDDPDGPVTLTDVEALHTHIDDSGDLAWFAPSEIAAVVEVVSLR